MKTHWETGNDHLRHQVHVGATYVTLSEGTGFTEIGSDWTHEQFLGGKEAQHAVAVAHGPVVLAEVIAAVQAAKNYPPFVATRSEEEDHLARFLAIPLDDALPGLRSNASPSVFGNGAHGETVVRSDSVTLTLDGLHGAVCPNDRDGPRTAFRLEGWGATSGVVAWNDQFCVMQGGNFVLIDSAGGVELFPVDRQLKLGQALRLNDGFRHPDAWIFSYWWLGVSLPPGLFRYEYGKGLTGRWQEPG